MTLFVGHKGNHRTLGSVLCCCHHLASGSPSYRTDPWDVRLTALVGFLLPEEVHLARAIPVQRCSLCQICALTSESREPQTSVILGNLHRSRLLLSECSGVSHPSKTEKWWLLTEFIVYCLGLSGRHLHGDPILLLLTSQIFFIYLWETTNYDITPKHTRGALKLSAQKKKSRLNDCLTLWVLSFPM